VRVSTFSAASARVRQLVARETERMRVHSDREVLVGAAVACPHFLKANARQATQLLVVERRYCITALGGLLQQGQATEPEQRVELGHARIDTSKCAIIAAAIAIFPADAHLFR